jgi:hypothetical protein
VMLGLAVPVEHGARLVDALLLAAEVERIRDPELAAAYTALADEIGDALDASPAAPGWTPVPPRGGGYRGRGDATTVPPPAARPSAALRRPGGPVLRAVPG